MTNAMHYRIEEPATGDLLAMANDRGVGREIARHLARCLGSTVDLVDDSDGQVLDTYDRNGKLASGATWKRTDR